MKATLLNMWAGASPPVRRLSYRRRLACSAALLCAAHVFAGDLQILSDNFLFTEGPAADAAGNIFFTDIRANRIYKLPTSGKITVFRENSGGANGLCFAPDGNLLICEGNNKRVTSISPDGELTVLASEYEGKPFNKPNDLWLDPKGGVYFTDPVYGRGVKASQDGEHVYYIAPDRARIIRVIDDFVRPNGIMGTPDGKTLYVADHGDSRIWKYAINVDGTLREKKLFAESRSDGMTLDAAGNLYATQDSILVFSPEGQQINEIETPDRPTNVTFGGIIDTTLFITAHSHLCSITIKGDRK